MLHEDVVVCKVEHVAIACHRALKAIQANRSALKRKCKGSVKASRRLVVGWRLKAKQIVHRVRDRVGLDPCGDVAAARDSVEVAGMLANAAGLPSASVAAIHNCLERALAWLSRRAAALAAQGAVAQLASANVH